MDDVIVRMHHRQPLGYCARGVRRVFKLHGLDYGSFLKSGIRASELIEATNSDAMVMAMIEVARGR